MKTAILCSGGDCAGMNPAIKYYVEASLAAGDTPHFVHRGFEGLIDGDIRKVSYADVAGIVARGGTIIRSARSERFKDPAARATAAANLTSHEITGLLVLGGDGSNRGLELLCREHQLRGIGIPATIDNDVTGSDYCLGVDSALNAIGRCLDQIRDTAASFRRAFVVETMGRESGYLALVSAISSGAEICLIPEIPFDLDAIVARMRREFEGGREYAIAVVSEATQASARLVSRLREEIGIESRLTILGHIQRGGSPTAFDRRTAFEFADAAVDALRDISRTASFLGYQGASITEHPPGAPVSPLPETLMERGQRLAN
jgi:6-phosphofructokinase 1